MAAKIKSSHYLQQILSDLKNVIFYRKAQVLSINNSWKKSEPGLRNVLRCIWHAFHTTSHNNIIETELYGECCKHGSCNEKDPSN